MHNHSKGNSIILRQGMIGACLRWQGWPSALLDFGPGLNLRTRAATLRQHLRLLLPARAYIYRQEDLHEDAMQYLFDNF
jgi:hypothetical protein